MPRPVRTSACFASPLTAAASNYSSTRTRGEGSKAPLRPKPTQPTASQTRRFADLEYDDMPSIMRNSADVSGTARLSQVSTSSISAAPPKQSSNQSLLSGSAKFYPQSELPPIPVVDTGGYASVKRNSISPTSASLCWCHRMPPSPHSPSRIISPRPQQEPGRGGRHQRGARAHVRIGSAPELAERMGRGASGPAAPPVASTLCRCSTRPLS